MSTSAPEQAALLGVTGLSAYYGELRALHTVSFEVAKGEVLSIIGANGAGKSTLLKSIVGMMSRGLAAHIEGTITYGGRRIDLLPTEAIVQAGIALVPEGRRLFQRLTVEENLLAGAYLPRARAGAAARMGEIYGLFPAIADRRTQLVSHLSGGEQQMVAIGRALMSEPELILFDEISLGLAPVVVDEIYARLDAIRAGGVTCIIVEQDMKRALRVASHVFVLLEGHVVLDGTPESLSEEQVSAAYFGSNIGGFGE